MTSLADKLERLRTIVVDEEKRTGITDLTTATLAFLSAEREALRATARQITHEEAINPSLWKTRNREFVDKLATGALDAHRPEDPRFGCDCRTCYLARYVLNGHRVEASPVAPTPSSTELWLPLYRVGDVPTKVRPLLNEMHAEAGQPFTKEQLQRLAQDRPENFRYDEVDGRGRLSVKAIFTPYAAAAPQDDEPATPQGDEPEEGFPGAVERWLVDRGWVLDRSDEKTLWKDPSDRALYPFVQAVMVALSDEQLDVERLARRDYVAARVRARVHDELSIAAKR